MASPRTLLTGETSFMPLPDILQWHEQNRKSAILTLEAPDGNRSIHFENGLIVFASSSKPGQQLGEYLEQAGHLEKETVETSLLESRRFKICFTRYLIEEQMLCTEVLTQSITELAEKILIDILLRKNCYFRVMPLEINCDDSPINITAAHLIMDVIRKLDEVNHIKTH
jgi:hypothetical protein